MRPEAARIVLVGFMGSGKSTVGPLVARELGWGFVDLDDLVERAAGASVAAIFERHGEAGFRELEREAAGRAARLDRHVVAAGGGALGDPGTRAALARGAVTVWLRCDLETIAARVGDDPRRPLAGSRETMRRLLDSRESLYRAADLVVDTSAAAPEDVARAVVRGVAPWTGREAHLR